MKCPICPDQTLEDGSLEDGLNAMVCPGCDGSWVPSASYAVWLEGHSDTSSEGPFSEVEADVEDVREAKLCPGCGSILLKYKVGHGLDFYVDHCGGCGAIWFDRNEWRALKAHKLHDEIHRVFSTPWQTNLREGVLRKKMDGVYLRRFGEKSYARVCEIHAWLMEQPHRDALLAFLADDNPYSLTGPRSTPKPDPGERL